MYTCNKEECDLLPPIYIQVVVNLGHMTFESVSDWSFDSERIEPEEDDLDIDDDGSNELHVIF